MKKNFIKHSSVVVAALLAAASVGAATGNVKADTTNTVTENGHFYKIDGNATIVNPIETVTTDKDSEDQPKANTTAGTKVTPKTDNPTLSDSKGDQSAQGGQKQNTPASGTQTGNNTSTGNASDSTNTSNDNVTQGSNTNAGSTIGNTTNGSNQGTTNNGQTTNGSTTTTGTTTNINGTQNTTNSNNTTANNNSSANNSSTSTSQQPADNNSNSTTETTSTSTTSAAKPVVRIAQRSYVYTKSGKIARKNGKRVVLKKSSTRSLSNAKLVTIKGQKYYQIGKNQYVKASNVIAPIRKANVRAVVKGRKNARVRAYTSTGKRTRSYLSGRKSYKFTARRSINGRTYYKVSGRNLWIPASKLNIR